jgi:hypothetical protein
LFRGTQGGCWPAAKPTSNRSQSGSGQHEYIDDRRRIHATTGLVHATTALALTGDEFPRIEGGGKCSIRALRYLDPSRDDR